MPETKVQLQSQTMQQGLTTTTHDSLIEVSLDLQEKLSSPDKEDETKLKTITAYLSFLLKFSNKGHCKEYFTVNWSLVENSIREIFSRWEKNHDEVKSKIIMDLISECRRLLWVVSYRLDV